jgi:hypothetical protein
VGAVFTKYNLLRAEDVQQLYKAVNKRLGRAAGPVRVAEPPKGKGRKARKAAKGKSGRRAGARKVDPNTLWKGIAGGVVFLGVLIAMFVLIITSGTDKEGGEKTGTQAKEVVVKDVSPEGAGETATSPETEGTSGEGKKEEPKVDETFAYEHRHIRGEIRRTALVDENVQKALDLLNTFREKNAEFYKMYPHLLKELESLEKEIKGEGEEASGEEEEGFPPAE